jgi:holo-[acyl-carrier protein] synthase
MRVGIDIVKIDRIEKLFDKYGEKFLNRIFHREEIEEIEKVNNFKRKIEKIAGKFAAKESVFKVDNRFVDLKKIEILTDDKGQPFVKNFPHINVSVSHEKEYAVAVAVLMER